MQAGMERVIIVKSPATDELHETTWKKVATDDDYQPI